MPRFEQPLGQSTFQRSIHIALFILRPGTLEPPNPVDQKFEMSLIHRPKQLTTAGIDQPKTDSKTSDFCADIVGMNRQVVSH
jgi:hypothetical protein